MYDFNPDFNEIELKTATREKKKAVPDSYLWLMKDLPLR